ncbi:unnamed protein product, partial [Hymenolepis diminuta]
MDGRNFPRPVGRSENAPSIVDSESNIIDTKKSVNHSPNTTTKTDADHKTQSFHHIHGNCEEPTFQGSLKNKKLAAAFSYYGNKKVPLPRRRPYTASELASAVRAICSGQLGTRRAASVYGIPRS